MTIQIAMRLVLILHNLYFKPFKRLGHTMSFKSSLINVANCKAARAIIEDKYPNIFWSGCLVHILNLLMHDIVNMKDPSYLWIGALYKRGKKMIKASH